MNIIRHSFASGAALGLAAASLCLPLTATASDITGRDIAVRFADLDAATVDGATQLLGRIEHAAARVCAPLNHGDLGSRQRQLHCQQTLTAAAVARVDSPVLASLHQAARREAPRVIAQAK